VNAIILSIGDELVLGQTIDTNSAWLSQQLAAVGCPVSAHVTVPDDQPTIERAIRDSAFQCTFLIISGGIGPTEDDLTRQALAAVMDAPLEMNERWLGVLKDFFAQRGRTMPEINKIQAMIPRGAEMIYNHAGTAAGIYALLSVGDLVNSIRREADVAPTPFGEGDRIRCQVFVMPGVPREMMLMFRRDVLPKVERLTGGAVILSRTLHTFGWGESQVGEALGPLMDRRRNPSVGTTVSGGIVSLRINARFASLDDAKRELETTDAACRAALGDLVYGRDEETLPDVLYPLLTRRSAPRTDLPPYTIATAESCTAGLLAKMLTDVSGSSAYYKQGWITYTNESKSQLLGVPADLIQQHGAVSRPAAEAMATGARERAGSDFALAITGVAGPTGGTAAKPVGTVCIALGHGGGVASWQFLFPGPRDWVRDRSAKMTLTILRYHLLGKPLPF